MEPVNPCCICLNEMLPNNVATLECGHKMDLSCYVKYCVTRMNVDFDIRCPLCRANQIKSEHSLSSETIDGNKEEILEYLKYTRDLFNNQMMPSIHMMLRHNHHYEDRDDFISSMRLVTEGFAQKMNDKFGYLERDIRDGGEEPDLEDTRMIQFTPTQLANAINTAIVNPVT